MASPHRIDTSTPSPAYPAQGKIDVPKPPTGDTVMRGREVRRSSHSRPGADRRTGDDLALADACT
jgi:hypothetical protein